MHPALKLAAYADPRALPEDARAEVLGGRVFFTMPAQRPQHSRAPCALARFVCRPFDDVRLAAVARSARPYATERVRFSHPIYEIQAHVVARRLLEKT
jgi:hypothetical protein